MADRPVVVQSDSGSNGVGFLLGVVLIIAFVFALIYYGIPMIQNATQGGGTQINVPDQVDVNIKQE